jgi:hypothetical protein
VFYPGWVRAATAIVLMTLVLAAPAASAPPRGGLMIPGRSLGGLELGATKEQVLAKWGRRHGVCRRCRYTTWYFNYERFQPQGAGVEFRGNRAVALFTLWSPEGWTTPKGLRLGDPAARIDELYVPHDETACRGYSALTLRTRRVVTAFYRDNDAVWAFGLSRPGIRLCR